MGAAITRRVVHDAWTGQSRGSLLLTFDDGPHPEYTPRGCAGLL